MRLGPGLERRDWGQGPQGPTTPGQWVGDHQETAAGWQEEGRRSCAGQRAARGLQTRCENLKRSAPHGRARTGSATAEESWTGAGPGEHRGPSAKTRHGGSGSGVGRPSTVYVQCYSDEAGWVEQAPPRETYIGQGSRTETEKVCTRAGAGSCQRQRKLEISTDSDEGSHNTRPNSVTQESAGRPKEPAIQDGARASPRYGQPSLSAGWATQAAGGGLGRRRGTRSPSGKMGASLLSQSVSQSSQSVSQGRTGTAEPAGPTGTFPSQIRS